MTEIFNITGFLLNKIFLLSYFIAAPLIVVLITGFFYYGCYDLPNKLGIVLRTTFLMLGALAILWVISAIFIGGSLYRDAKSDFLKKYTDYSAPDKTRTQLGTELRRYILVDWNPPKHFYVTLKDANSGHVIEQLYISKHCNTKDLRRGDFYNIQLKKYSMSDTPTLIQYEFSNLQSTFCGS